MIPSAKELQIIQQGKIFALADELKSLRDKKSDLEASVKETTAKIDEVDYNLSELMAETETQNFTRAGTMFCLTTKTRASAVSSVKDKLHAALKGNGYGDLVYEVVNANSLSSFVKEQIENNNDKLPQWLTGLVHVFDKTTVSVRKATKR
jgi:predicted nuclease with TOPRIM domain